MANSADPDQLASSEANWSGSTLFAKQGISGFSRTRVKWILPFLNLNIPTVANMDSDAVQNQKQNYKQWWWAIPAGSTLIPKYCQSIYIWSAVLIGINCNIKINQILNIARKQSHRGYASSKQEFILPEIVMSNSSFTDENKKKKNTQKKTPLIWTEPYKCLGDISSE